MLSKQQLLANRKRLVLNMTASERELERLLSSKNWRRKLQYRLGFYILDFVFPYKMLVVELDGPSHQNSKDYDSYRDAWIEKFGFRVIRFSNSVVWRDSSQILQVVENSSSHPRRDFLIATGQAHAEYNHRR